MRLNLRIFIGILSISSTTSLAQVSADCRSAVPVCADTPIIGVSDGSGSIDDFDPDLITQTGCLEKGSLSSANIEHNTAWYVFRAGTDGQVGFDIEAMPTAGQTSITAEWDFAVYGPNVACNAISNGTAQPIRCNYEVNATNFTGVGINPINGQVGAAFIKGSQNTYDEWLEVRAGEIYYILINNYNTNFDGDPESFRLTFTGNSVLANQNTSLDCTLRDEFLGQDIAACAGDPEIVLSAINSPAGSGITNVSWSVDYDDDGNLDQDLLSGSQALVYTVPDLVDGRYFVEIETTAGGTVKDDILIQFHGVPVLDRVEILENNLSRHPDKNNIEIFIAGSSAYEYAINGGAFQDESVFYDVPPGINSLIINDLNGCGATAAIDFLVLGYPKFFTPNGDRVNDTWEVHGDETLFKAATYIFDRYGKLLAFLDPRTVWDGNYKGRPMPSSDYWFQFEYEQSNNGVLVAKTRQTHFTLKR